MTAPQSSELGNDPLFLRAQQHYRALINDGLTRDEALTTINYERFIAHHHLIRTGDDPWPARDAALKLSELRSATRRGEPVSVIVSLNGAKNVNIHQWISLTYGNEADDLKKLYEALDYLRDKKIIEGYRIEVTKEASQ